MLLYGKGNELRVTMIATRLNKTIKETESSPPYLEEKNVRKDSANKCEKCGEQRQLLQGPEIQEEKMPTVKVLAGTIKEFYIYCLKVRSF